MDMCVFNCQQARAIDLVDYLTSLGYRTAKIRGNNYWYASPFREEKEPSFKVDRQVNLWYDHGWGRGGDMVEFGVQFYHRSVREVLKILQEFGAHSGDPMTGNSVPGNPVAENPVAANSRIEVLQAKPIGSTRLHYLQKRRIPLAIAAEFCREVHYRLYGKNYFAIGFPNRSGGYELRNEFFKGAASPKDISLINRGASVMTVFEGFMDFLSYHTIYQHQSPPLTNFLVLNSLAYFEKVLPMLDEYAAVQLYLDNDPAGRRHTELALQRHSRYQDCSPLYRQYKDLNEWLMYPGLLDKSTEKQKLSRQPDPPCIAKSIQNR
jgi:Toprim-like/CHC2 zinc finger